MSHVPELDSLGEIYAGFDRHRAILKQHKADAATIWRKAFEAVQQTEEFYQRSNQDIARETMRMLMDVLGH
jgi:hypothetical protein